MDNLTDIQRQFVQEAEKIFPDKFILGTRYGPMVSGPAGKACQFSMPIKEHVHDTYTLYMIDSDYLE